MFLAKIRIFLLITAQKGDLRISQSVFFRIFVKRRKIRQMEQLIINVEDRSILPSLKNILKAIDGVSIAKKAGRKKGGLDQALEDVREGRVNQYDSAEEMFKALGL